MIMNMKQKKIEVEPRIKLNYNIFIVKKDQTKYSAPQALACLYPTNKPRKCCHINVICSNKISLACP